jgi:hypothetical protein
MWFLKRERTNARLRDLKDAACGASFLTHAFSSHRMTSRAVNRKGNDGGPGVFGVGPDRFDHQIEFIGAVDFARHTVGLARHQVVGFGEVVQPINALDVAGGLRPIIPKAASSRGRPRSTRLMSLSFVRRAEPALDPRDAESCSAFCLCDSPPGRSAVRVCEAPSSRRTPRRAAPANVQTLGAGRMPRPQKV